MIIKLALLDKDERFISRLAERLGASGDDSVSFQFFLFSSLDDYQRFRENGKIDILIASTESLESLEELGEGTPVAFFSEDKKMTRYMGCPAICKYQRSSEILRGIQGAVAELINSGRGQSYMMSHGRVFLFAGAAGGMGTSTAAVGCAAHFAAKGEKVVYISYQQSAQNLLFFKKRGESMSEVHYVYQEWLRRDEESDGHNSSDYLLQMRLKSLLAHDPTTGVDCFDDFRLPIDMMDLKGDEIVAQINALTGVSDVCVVDMDGCLCDDFFRVVRTAGWVVLVSDGSKHGNLSTKRMLDSFNALNDSGEELFNREIGILYNRFGSESETDTAVSGLFREIGKIPRYQNASSEQIVMEVAKSNLFDTLERWGVFE